MADWIPAITSTTALALVLWLSRQLIATRLTASVRHEFDEQLEKVRSEARQKEEVIRATLRAQEAELTALREGPLTAMTSRQVEVAKRRIEAVDQLWSAVYSLRKAKATVATMSVVKFEPTAARAQTDPKMREMFQAIGGDTDITKLDLSDAARARPYIPKQAWATYTALLSVLSFASLRLQIIRTGADADLIADSSAINNVLKAVLPDRADFIEQVGDAAHMFLVEQIENKLLDQLVDMLEGRREDEQAVTGAAEILKRATELQKVTTATQMDLAEQ